jgi:hypothetical protein
MDNFFKDRACSVWNFSTPKYEVLLVFCSFLCVSLNVLVSFLIIVEILLKMEKSHWHIQTYTQKWTKYQWNFMFRIGRVSNTTCIIFINFYLWYSQLHPLQSLNNIQPETIVQKRLIKSRYRKWIYELNFHLKRTST